ncbi:peroxidase [Fulvimarina pelagi HTCC2506]|uniref:Peroxidase n=1 Tax=Fulvimarina pelagi HTCC2506 TaxID=314231 RepID=Q0G342_9HYPH|nr:peroxidase [Fulvimarina pelagi HTCC2506]
MELAGNLDPYTSWEDFQVRNGLSDDIIAQMMEAYPDLVLSTPEEIAAFVAVNPDIALMDGPNGSKIVSGIDRVDLWVGGLAEKHVMDGIVGQTFWVVLHEQFDRLQEGDRFYYLDRFDNFDFYETFVDGQDFSDIVARNTGLTGLPEDIFVADLDDDEDRDDDDDHDNDEDDDDVDTGTDDDGDDDGTGTGTDDDGDGTGTGTDDDGDDDGTGTDDGGDGDGTDDRGAFTLTARDLEGLKNLVNGRPAFEGDDDTEGAAGVRELLGRNNNENNPEFGSADEVFIRLTEARYGEYDATINNRAVNPIFAGLDPREISNILGVQEADLAPAKSGANTFFMAFGQYFDHGLDFLPKDSLNGVIEIGGPGSARAPGVDNPADLTRGKVHVIDENGIPQHLNKASPFVDQNQAYGSNELVGQFLRESDGAQGFGMRLLAGADDPSNPESGSCRRCVS